MANFNDTTLSKSAFKLLQNKAHTANSKEFFNEIESTTLTLGSQEVFGVTLPFDPVDAVLQGLAAHVSLALVLDSSSVGKGYFATITTVVGTDLDGYQNPRTGLVYADGDRVGYIIPPKFDEPPPPPPGPPPAQSYRAILKNNGIEVPSSDASNWYIDYRAGIVVSENNLSLINGTLDGYVYIGQLLSDRLDVFESSGITWSVDGSNIRNTNSGDVLPDVDLGASLGNVTNRWSSVNVGPGSLHVRSLSSESGGLARDWKQYLDLPSGDMRFAEASNDYLTITTAGKIGIGTNSPTDKLSISSGTDSVLSIESTAALDPLLKLGISGGSNFAIGIDNSDSDNFKISRGAVLGGGTDDIVIKAADGYIGVNLAVPYQRLHVDGSIRLGQAGGSHSIIGDSHMAVAAESNLLLVGFSSQTVGLPGAGFGDIIFGVGSDSANQSAQFLQMFPSVVPRVESMRVSGSTGNVGIGITNATQKFQVGSSIVADATNVRIGIGTASPADNVHIYKAVASGKVSALIENTSNTANAFAAIDFKANTTDGFVGVYEDSHADGPFMEISATDTGMHIRFDTEGSEKMRIESDGKVGIGVTNPSYNLHIGTGTVSNTAQRKVVLSNSTNNQRSSFSNVAKDSGGVSVEGVYEADGTGQRVIFGALTNHEAQLRTNDIVRQTWLETGEVGIGTATPVTTIHLYNGNNNDTQTNFTQALTSASLLITSDYVSGDFIPGLFWSTQNDSSTKPKAGIYPKLTSSGSFIYFGTSNSYSTGITNDAMVIRYDGNIGIGSADPTYPLQIVRSVNSNTTLEVKNSTSGTAAYSQFSSTVTTGSVEMQAISTGYTTSGLIIANTGRLHTSSGLTGGLVISTDSAAPMIFGTNNAERMRIDSSGNIGIGITNPTERFEISNGATAVDIFVAKENTTKVFVLPDGMSAPSVSSQVLYTTDTLGSAAWGHINNLLNDRGDLSFYNFEEFVGWDASTVPYGIYEPYYSGGSISMSGEDANHPGVVCLFGGDALDRVSLKTTPVFYGPSGSQRYDLQCLVYFDAVTQTGQNWAFKFGLSNNYFADVDGTEEVSISIDAGSNSFRAKVIANSVVTYNSTIGVTAAENTWYKMSIAFVNGIAVMTINGTVESTGAVTTPTLGPMQNLLAYTKVTGTDNYSCYADYSSILVTGLTR